DRASAFGRAAPRDRDRAADTRLHDRFVDEPPRQLLRVADRLPDRLDRCVDLDLVLLSSAHDRLLAVFRRPAGLRRRRWRAVSVAASASVFVTTGCDATTMRKRRLLPALVSYFAEIR